MITLSISKCEVFNLQTAATACCNEESIFKSIKLNAARAAFQTLCGRYCHIDARGYIRRQRRVQHMISLAANEDTHRRLACGVAPIQRFLQCSPVEHEGLRLMPAAVD